MNNRYSSILAIETATSACSVALSVDGKSYSRMQVGNNIHSQVLLTMVNDVLLEAATLAADLQVVVVGQGPGSFTGLRIGIGIAQGLAYGAGCPMLGISSLEALAQQAEGTGRVIAGIDARMGEVYWCEFELGGRELQRCGELRVTKPELIVSSSGQTPILVGNAWSEYWLELNVELQTTAKHLSFIVYPNATALLEIAMERLKNPGAGKRLCSPVDFTPEYVRDDVAKKAVKTT